MLPKAVNISGVSRVDLVRREVAKYSELVCCRYHVEIQRADISISYATQRYYILV